MREADRRILKTHRFSPLACALLEKLRSLEGMTETFLLEKAIREYAGARGIDIRDVQRMLEERSNAYDV